MGPHLPLSRTTGHPPARNHVSSTGPYHINRPRVLPLLGLLRPHMRDAGKVTSHAKVKVILLDKNGMMATLFFYCYNHYCHNSKPLSPRKAPGTLSILHALHHLMVWNRSISQNFHYRSDTLDESAGNSLGAIHMSPTSQDEDKRASPHDTGRLRARAPAGTQDCDITGMLMLYESK